MEIFILIVKAFLIAGGGVLIDKTAETGRFDFIKQHLRISWIIFLFFTLVIFITDPVIWGILVKINKSSLFVHAWAQYCVLFVLGGLSVCGIYWISGFISSLSPPTTSPDIPNIVLEQQQFLAMDNDNTGGLLLHLFLNLRVKNTGSDSAAGGWRLNIKSTDGVSRFDIMPTLIVPSMKLVDNKNKETIAQFHENNRLEEKTIIPIKRGDHKFGWLYFQIPTSRKEIESSIITLCVKDILDKETCMKVDILKKDDKFNTIYIPGSGDNVFAPIKEDRIIPSPSITSLQPPGIPGPEDDVVLPSLPMDDSWKALPRPQKKNPAFKVAFGTSLLRQRQGLIMGPYVSEALVCPSSKLIAVDYFAHMRITNLSSIAATIISYTIQVKTNDNAWETLFNVRLSPLSRVYFVHKIGPQITEVIGAPLLDNALRENVIVPGGIISGYALFAFPKDHNKLAQSKFTLDSGDLSIGQFPRPHIQISLTDSLGRVTSNAPTELEYGPNSIEASTIHFKFGPVLAGSFELSTVATCKNNINNN